MGKSLLDTDTFSEIIKGINPNIIRRASIIGASSAGTPSRPSLYGDCQRLHRLRREDRIRELMERIGKVEVLTLDVQSSELAGRIYADLEGSGQTIGLADPMIAAIAVRYSLTLVTGNMSHYQRIRSLGYQLPR